MMLENFTSTDSSKLESEKLTNLPAQNKHQTYFIQNPDILIHNMYSFKNNANVYFIKQIKVFK